MILPNVPSVASRSLSRYASSFALRICWPSSAVPQARRRDSVFVYASPPPRPRGPPPRRLGLGLPIPPPEPPRKHQRAKLR